MPEGTTVSRLTERSSLEIGLVLALIAAVAWIFGTFATKEYVNDKVDASNKELKAVLTSIQDGQKEVNSSLKEVQSQLFSLSLVNSGGVKVISEPQKRHP